MTTSTRTRSAAVWVVIALALVAIAWKLVSRPVRVPDGAEPVARAVVAPAEVAELQAPSLTLVQADAPSSAPEPLPSARAVPLVMSDEPGDASVHGYVLPVAGTTLGDGHIWISWTDRLGRTNRTQAAEDGAYAFAGMRPGRYWFRAGADLSAEASESIDVAGERRLDFQLAARPVVRVKVVGPTGAAVEEKLFLIGVATVEPPGTWMDEISGSMNNTFGVGNWWSRSQISDVLTSEHLGQIVLDVDPPVHVSLVAYQYVVATQRVERGQNEVTFVVDPASKSMQRGRLRLRPVDALTRAPITSGGVQIDGAAMRMGSLKSGAALEWDLTPGTYVVHVRAKGFGDPSLRVRIEPGVLTDLDDLALAAETTISARVVDATGEGVSADVYHDACGTDGEVLAHVGSRHVVKSTGDGALRIAGLAPGLHRLRTSVDGVGRWSRVVDTRGCSVEDLEIRLERTVPLVVHVDEVAWANARLRIVDREGGEHHASRVWSSDPRPIQLVPGSYTVEFRSNPAAEPQLVPILIEDVPLELALP